MPMPPNITINAITIANGSICTTSVGMSTPTTCSAVAAHRLAPNSSAPTSTQHRAAARQHREHDADEAGAAGHEGHEHAGADVRHVGAAEPGQKAPCTSTASERMRRHVDARGIERGRLVARPPRGAARSRSRDTPTSSGHQAARSR